MFLIDTHAHLYLEHFDSDRHEVIRHAISSGVECMLLPNIDRDSVASLMELHHAFPGNCLPMMGLHPTSVKADYLDQLNVVSAWFDKEKYCAVGEIGIDLYWDKTFQKEQEKAFRFQIGLAKKYDLPIAIHTRDSFTETWKILNEEYEPGLKGVFHCFSGNIDQARQVISLGFKLGIGGVLTYKNSGLEEAVSQTGMEHILLETDAPFLTPVPFRGKRNESAFLTFVAEKLARIKHITIEEVAKATTRNAIRLFQLWKWGIEQEG